MENGSGTRRFLRTKSSFFTWSRLKNQAGEENSPKANEKKTRIFFQVVSPLTDGVLEVVGDFRDRTSGPQYPTPFISFFFFFYNLSTFPYKPRSRTPLLTRAKKFA